MHSDGHLRGSSPSASVDPRETAVIPESTTEPALSA